MQASQSNRKPAKKPAPKKQPKATPKANRKLNGVRGVESTESPQATKYDATGQKTGQVTSYFSWWLAVSGQSGLLMDYMSTVNSVRRDGKISFIGEVAGVGRIINNDQLEATAKPNGDIWVTLEDGTEVMLYPSVQIRPGSEVIHNYWFTDPDTKKDFTFEDSDQLGKATEHPLEIHGYLLDGCEISVLVTRTIDFAAKHDGTLLATGAGQRRYILRQPTTRDMVRAWRANSINAVASFA